MKKLRDSIGLLIILLVAASLFSANTKEKRSVWKYIVIPILCIIFGGVVLHTLLVTPNDCAPQTLQRVFPSHSFSEIKRICRTDSTGTTYVNLTNAWNKLSTNQLIVTYSSLTNIPVMEEEHVNFDHPYIWLGSFQGGGHCALIKFTPTNVLFSHSEFVPGTTNYYKTSMDYSNFFVRTYVILKAKDLNENIRM